MSESNKINNILNRIEDDRGLNYTLSYPISYSAESARLICTEFLGMNFDVNNSSMASKCLHSLNEEKKRSLIREICVELKKIRHKHLLLNSCNLNHDNKDVFFNTRGRNLRYFIHFIDDFIGDRSKFHSYIIGSLTHNFLQRMENHVKNTQLKIGVKEKDLHKIEFLDEKLEYKEDDD